MGKKIVSGIGSAQDLLHGLQDAVRLEGLDDKVHGPQLDGGPLRLPVHGQDDPGAGTGDGGPRPLAAGGADRGAGLAAGVHPPAHRKDRRTGPGPVPPDGASASRVTSSSASRMPKEVPPSPEPRSTVTEAAWAVTVKQAASTPVMARERSSRFNSRRSSSF